MIKKDYHHLFGFCFIDQKWPNTCFFLFSENIIDLWWWWWSINHHLYRTHPISKFYLEKESHDYSDHNNYSYNHGFFSKRERERKWKNQNQNWSIVLQPDQFIISSLSFLLFYNSFFKKKKFSKWRIVFHFVFWPWMYCLPFFLLSWVAGVC